MAGRTRAVVDSGRIGHVALVVRAIEIHTIPAAGEEDLGTKAIGAKGDRINLAEKHGGGARPMK